MKNQNNQIKKGILLALAASILSGVAIFYSKISVGQIPPLILTTSRNFYVGLIFLLLVLLSGRLSEIKKLTQKQLGLLLLVGIVGGALPFYLFFSGLQSVQAISANLIQKSLFIWVALLAVVFLKEKLNRWYFISFGLVMVANFYFAKLSFTFGKGELMIFAATLLWSCENIMAKKILKNVSSELVGLFRMGVGGILLVLTSLLTGKGNIFLTLDMNKLLIIFIGGTILFFYVFTWYKALKYAPASLVTLILSFAVVVGNVLNGSFAGVKILPKDIYSSTLIAGATAIILIQTKVFPHLLASLQSGVRNLLNRFPLGDNSPLPRE